MREISLVFRGPWTAFVLLILGFAAMGFIAEIMGFKDIAKTYYETNTWLIGIFAFLLIIQALLRRR